MQEIASQDHGGPPLLVLHRSDQCARKCTLNKIMRLTPLRCAGKKMHISHPETPATCYSLNRNISLENALLQNLHRRCGLHLLGIRGRAALRIGEPRAVRRRIIGIGIREAKKLNQKPHLSRGVTGGAPANSKSKAGPPARPL